MKYAVIMYNNHCGFENKRKCIGVYDDYYSALGKVITFFDSVSNDKEFERITPVGGDGIEIERYTVEVGLDVVTVEIYKWEENEDE